MEDKKLNNVEYIKSQINIEDFKFILRKYNNPYGWGSITNAFCVDSKGNLLFEFNFDNFKKEITSSTTHNDNVSREDFKNIDSKLLNNIIDEMTKQIRFLETQDRIKGEIKGYPEYSEKVLELYNIDETISRFRHEKSLLRAMLKTPTDVKNLKILLSILKYKDNTYYRKLYKHGIINSKQFPVKNEKVRKMYEYVYRLIYDYETLCPIDIVFEDNGIPYSEDFVNNMIYKEKVLDIFIQNRWKILRRGYYRELCKLYADGNEDEIKNMNSQLDYIDLQIRKPLEDSTYINLKEIYNTRSTDNIMLTGINELDTRKAYLSKGKITTVFGYTASFKTMFCSNVAYNNILFDKHVVYISLEIRKEEMYFNLLSRYSFDKEHKVSHSDIKSNNLTETDKDYLFGDLYFKFKDELKDNIIIYDETDIDANNEDVFISLLANANDDFLDRTGRGIDIVIIDHINLLKYDGNTSKNSYSVANEWMSFFRKQCVNFLNKKEKVAILCACQSSREGYKEALRNKKYKLTSIAESNEIERSSQLVLSIYSDKETKSNGLVKMQILKSRDNRPYDYNIDVNIEPEYYAFGVSNIKSTDNIKNNNTNNQYMVENDISKFKDNIDKGERK